MDKCPCCGSPFDAQMQITNLKKELELSFKSVVGHHEAQTADLKERLEAWREYGIYLSKGGIEEAIIAKQKLKDLGEI